MRYYIYTLIDPRDYKVRYVGRTRQRMDTRLSSVRFPPPLVSETGDGGKAKPHYLVPGAGKDHGADGLNDH